MLLNKRTNEKVGCMMPGNEQSAVWYSLLHSLEKVKSLMSREVTSHLEGDLHPFTININRLMQVHRDNPPPNGLTAREKPKTAYWKINFHTSAL